MGNLKPKTKPKPKLGYPVYQKNNLKPFEEVFVEENLINYVEDFHNVLSYEEKKSVPCVPIRMDGTSLVLAAPEDAWELARDLGHKKGLTLKLIPAEVEHILGAIALSNTLIESKTIFSSDLAADGQAPIASLVQKLIERAVLERASDLHFEPYENILLVRIRVDGRLHDLFEFPSEMAAPILSRIKVLSLLNIIEKLRPQDGQFTIELPTRKVDIRVATSNTIHGEKIVLRIHDINRPSVSLDKLGMSGAQLTKFNKMIHASSGLILSAGPTGGGKTTTLHSALKEVNVDYKNVVTIEDPVEYVVDGISQIPVSDARGIGFAVQLRAILRQDPDIILVGETRDAETARISVQAALTGHLVLSSIHATDSIGAIYRLFQMEIEPHLVASSLRGVVSQRLIRRICEYCKVTKPTTPREQRILDTYQIDAKELSYGSGCLICSGTGYRDRIAAYQVLEITEELSEIISRRPEPHELRKVTKRLGLNTLSHEAIRLASEQVTTLSEALTLLEIQ